MRMKKLNAMTIRRSTYGDLPQLMRIYREARQIMLDSGDLNQWKEGYPPEDVIRGDIDRGVGYAVEDGDRLVGAFAFIPGTDPTYLRIEGGAWKDDLKPYCTIHRLGSLKDSKGVAEACFNWCWEQSHNLRVDTHEDNVIMRHCIAKAGFEYCGIIYLLNGDPRLAYQKVALPGKRLAMFDMDGVLYNSMPLHVEAWKRMMAEYGLPLADDAIYLHEGRTGRNTVEILLGPGNDGEKMYARKCRIFESFPKPSVMPGAPDAVRAVRKAGLEAIVVTGSGQDAILSRLDNDYHGLFRTGWMVTGRDVVHGKPAPEPYLKGLQNAGVDPDEAIVVENAPLGVAAGHAAGCQVMAVNTGPLPDTVLLDAGADMLFHSMGELAEALS